MLCFVISCLRKKQKNKNIVNKIILLVSGFTYQSEFGEDWMLP